MSLALAMEIGHRLGDDGVGSRAEACVVDDRVDPAKGGPGGPDGVDDRAFVGDIDFQRQEIAVDVAARGFHEGGQQPGRSGHAVAFGE